MKRHAYNNVFVECRLISIRVSAPQRWNIYLVVLGTHTHIIWTADQDFQRHLPHRPTCATGTLRTHISSNSCSNYQSTCRHLQQLPICMSSLATITNLHVVCIPISAFCAFCHHNHNHACSLSAWVTCRDMLYVSKSARWMRDYYLQQIALLSHDRPFASLLTHSLKHFR